MKNTWDWDEDDLLELVRTGTQESIELDFKDSASLQRTDPKKRELSKDVSAFANSAGGTLVYGVSEEKYTHVAKAVDTGSDPKEITKEWVEQVINSTIHQRIDGVRVRQILLTKTSPGRVAYVVYVPPSTRTPHQAIDKKFYKRFEFESVPMEEYEVRDLYRRRDTPDLRIQFLLQDRNLVAAQQGTGYAPIALRALITNDAVEPAEYAVIKMFVDKALETVSVGTFEKNDDVHLAFPQGKFFVTMLSMNWGIPGKMPIFNDANFELTEQPMMLKIPDAEIDADKVYLLGYQIKAPRMVTKQGFTFLTKTRDKVSLLDPLQALAEIKL